MKILVLSAILIGLLSAFRQTQISKIRKLYQSAAISATDARRLKDLLIATDSNSTATLYCYKGAIEMVQAKYSINPMVKLGSFGRGKAWMEQAISKDTANVEMRFIRFSIQSNLPAFLGYRDAIGKDRKFLMAHITETRDAELKEMIINYLKNTADSSKAELKGLRN